VWVPDVSDAEDIAAVDAEQLDAENLVDDMVMDDNDGSAQTEEDYVDPYAAEFEDFPEGDDVDEAGLGEDDASEDVEKIAKHTSVVAGPSSSTVYLEDIESARFSNPTGCEIWALFNSEDDYKTLMDPMLKSAYRTLPPLRSCTLTTWRSNNEIAGLVMWGSWRQQLRNPDMKYLSKFATFQHFDYFVNPARADPTLFSTFSPDNYLYTMRSHESKKTSLCLSPVFVVRSRLLEPHPRSQSNTSSGNRMLLKSLDCIFHSYEWERSSSFWCTVFGVDTMQAQLNGATISIETKPSNPSTTVDVESSAPGLFSATASPRKKKARSFSTSDVKIQLKHTDTIPIFDEQDKQIEFDQSLEHLDEVLPPFADEIPSGSLALVAYTANTYYRTQKGGQSGRQRSQSNKNLALNINWVVVLGIPK